MAIFYFEVKFDLEGQGQSPPKTIGILTKVFYTYGANLVILAWTGVELSRGQASDYRTHGRTDTQTDAGNDNTRRPKLASGKNYIWRNYYTRNIAVNELWFFFITDIAWVAISSWKIDWPASSVVIVGDVDSCKARCLAYTGCRSLGWTQATGSCALHDQTRLQVGKFGWKQWSGIQYLEYYFTPLGEKMHSDHKINSLQFGMIWIYFLLSRTQSFTV